MAIAVDEVTAVRAATVRGLADASVATQRQPGHQSLSAVPTTMNDMAKPTASEATDRMGNPLSEDPSVEDVERQADQMRIVPDSQLSTETINRVSADDLEQRRLRALHR